MKGRILLAIAAVLFFQSIEAAFGDWSAGDDYKMHSPQEPNGSGWDICLNHQGLADDFMCSETGKITDIHFWVSWRDDNESFETTDWTIQIFDDAGGRPGASLWTWNPSDGDVAYRLYGEGEQGWYCPSTGLEVASDHVNYYQVNITGIKGAFEQTRDTRYWLFIIADTLDEKTKVGWKSSTSEYYSPAAWLNSDKAWVVIGDTAYDLSFVITGEAASCVEHDEFDYSVGKMELLTSTGPETIYLKGVSAMDVNFEGWEEGTADDDDANGLEEVQTEMVELDLVGMSPAVGLVKMRLNPGLASEGQMEETVNNTPGVLDIPPFAPDGTVDSFFDVYFELEAIGQVFYTVTPMRWSSEIGHKPPGPLDIYEILQPVQLLDGQGNATEYYVGSMRYWPNPVVEVDDFDYSVGKVELVTPSGAEVIHLRGPSTMAVYFEGTTEGSADDNDGDTRDEVKTEMVELDLTGLSPVSGLVNMRLEAAKPSMGEMEETDNDTPGVLDIPPFAPDGTVDSFFDIYFELEVGGQLYYSVNPMYWSGEIGHKPPGPLDIYESLQQIPLYDAGGNSLPGYYLGTTQYRPNPVVEVDEFDYSIGEVQLQMQDGTTFMIDLSGPSAMAVYFEGTTEGTADDNDGDTRDEVKTEMVDLNLSGLSPVGLVNMRLNPSMPPSMGEMEETDNDTPGVLDVRPFAPDGTVDSFFDVYFELEIDGQVFYTMTPMRWSGEIGHKPPGPVDVYYGVSPIELVDGMGTATGILVLATRYQPNPCIRCSDFDGGGVTDMPDLRELAEDWLWVESVGDTYNAADLNCDWTITLSDFAIFAENWLQSCP